MRVSAVRPTNALDTRILGATPAPGCLRLRMSRLHDACETLRPRTCVSHRGRTRPSGSSRSFVPRPWTALACALTSEVLHPYPRALALLRASSVDCACVCPHFRGPIPPRARANPTASSPLCMWFREKRLAMVSSGSFATSTCPRNVHLSGHGSVQWLRCALWLARERGDDAALEAGGGVSPTKAPLGPQMGQHRRPRT